MLDGRYEILEIIGTGGMAVVYKARCHRLNRLVAVKILKSDLAQDADFRRRFHDESQAVAMLSHPNIVAVYDVSRSSKLEYIVMELIDGITLKQYMQRKGALNWREALHFITQIMKALSHAHSRGIIHRDIKPHNIMILRDGSVKVADFGIARLISSSQSTLTQEALGSVHYISPEQARGSHIDPRSDIYSAGVVLYEMLTGRLPFEGDSPVSVAIQHINSVPLSPREINPDIQEALEAITLKAMASKVENRYATANAMLADLEEFRKNPNIHFDYPPIETLQKDSENEPTQVLPKTGSKNGGKPKNGRTGAARGAKKPGAPKQNPDRVRPREMQEEEEMAAPRKNNSRLWTMGLAIGAILILIAGLYYVVYVGFISGLLAPTETYVVRDLIGKTIEEVRQNEEEYGQFEIIEGDTLPSESYEAGKIISQDPVAGREVKGNLQITVDISAGMPTINMKDVVNMESRTAKLLIDAMGLELDVEYTYASSDSITAGNVISSDPAEGVPLTRGETVTLTVSNGPEVKPVAMPSLYGMTLQRANELLVSLNLLVGNVTEVDSDEAAGIVVDQSVPSAIETTEGSAIDLQVSNGSQHSSGGTDASGISNDTGSESPSEVKDYPIQLALPDGTGNVYVLIKQDGDTVYENSVSKSQAYLNVTLTGSGMQYVEVYYDGVFQQGEYIRFSA
jgi:serine/threonine-protein kinase